MKTTAPYEDRADPPVVLPHWMVLCAGLVAAALALLASRMSHPGVGPDAVAYIGVANSIRDGNGIGFWLENPLVTWPPLWPMLIAAGTWLTRWRPDLVGLVINAGLLVGVAGAANAVAARVLRTRTLRLTMLVSLAISPLLVGLAVLVQTEVALTLVVLVVIVLILRYVEDQATWNLVVAGLVTAVGFYIRYQALYVVPVFAAWLVLRAVVRSGPKTTGAWLAAIRDAAAYSLPAVLPAAVWILRNLSLDEPPLGPRFPSDVGLAQNVVGALTTTFKFLTSIPDPPQVPAAVVTLVVLVAAVVWLGRRTAASEPVGRGWGVRVMDAAAGPVGLLVVFTGGFTALMVLSRSVVGFDDLDIRLLAPCLVPTSILFLRYVEVVFPAVPRMSRIAVAIVGIWLAAQAVVTFALVGPANNVLEDYGFNSPEAKAASTSAALDAIPKGCVVYSNNAGDLYRSGFEANLSPRKVEYKSDEPTDDLAELEARLRDGEQGCLAWVEYSEDSEFYSRDELRGVFDLEELGSADGVVTYRILTR